MFGHVRICPFSHTHFFHCVYHSRGRITGKADLVKQPLCGFTGNDQLVLETPCFMSEKSLSACIHFKIYIYIVFRLPHSVSPHKTFKP